METAEATARRMWTLFEPVHAVTYFAADARAAFESAGLRGFWRGYFAGRAAPLGPVAAEAAEASFYTFAPAMVGRALPAVWDLISPAEALAVRLTGAVTALRRLVSGSIERSVLPVADLLAEAAAQADVGGRPLATGNAALPVPDEPVARLWHAATVLREHRGDGHSAALGAAGLDSCEALVLRPGPDALPREQMQPLRGWSDSEWDSAIARLELRGLVSADGSATPDGRALRGDVERATDKAASGPWQDRVLADRIADLLAPIARACAAEQPYPSPVGAPSPAGDRQSPSTC